MSPARSAKPTYPTELPALAAPRRPKRPAVAERVLDSGLRVVAVRRPGVPLVEVRLRIPFQTPTSARSLSHLTRASVLSQNLI
jgi:zinc protease